MRSGGHHPLTASPRQRISPCHPSSQWLGEGKGKNQVLEIRSQRRFNDVAIRAQAITAYFEVVFDERAGDTHREGYCLCRPQQSLSRRREGVCGKRELDGVTNALERQYLVGKVSRDFVRWS